MAMLYLEVAPTAPLSAFIQLFWCLETSGNEGFGPPERIAPDGVVELVFHYRQPMRLRYAGEAFRPMPRSSVVSQTRRWVEIEAAGEIGLISVRFRPWGAHHFLGLPVSELADQNIWAEDLWGPVVRELEERLAVATDPGQRFSLVEEFLLQQWLRHREEDLEPLVRGIWRAKGQVRIAEFCERVGIGERRCQRLFSSALGLSPKRFARLTRFLHVCSRLRNGFDGELAMLALDCGYYDQSHFIADCRTFSGLSPTDLAAVETFSFLEIE